MSDLIRRSALINVLKERATNESIAGYMTAYDVTNSIIDEVEEQPTAYDINKVVEELEDYLFDKYCIENDSKIAEIVKQGGVSDDVCEWESDYKFVSDKYKRVTSCGYEFYDLHHVVPFKYCPYCRKKIKGTESEG